MLNKIWFYTISIAFLSACYQGFVVADVEIFQRMLTAIFDMAQLCVKLAIGLIGLLAFWLGIARVAEKSGAIQKLAHKLSPLFSSIMPEVPKGHPALGHVTMNMAANMMGLDNAATPLGLKAMQSLQSLNPKPDTASNAQILFLVLNTSSITLFPITVFMYRAQLGAASPTDVFLPILLATCASTLAGFLAVAYCQKLNLFRLKMLMVLGLFISLMSGLFVYLMTLTAHQLETVSSVGANFLILFFIVLILAIAHFKRVEVYQEFVEGAKEGFNTAVSIIPFLLAMLVAIAMLRSSGILDSMLALIGLLVSLFNGDTRFVDALPVAFLKPLSGSGARAMMIETINTHGVDSFAGRLAAIMQGSTETTFYVLAVYFGSVKIKYVRHAIGCGLFADFAGISAAILVAFIFYG
ncbi:spore maturation protein [Catenovulum sp. SM1970]|uniref:nucleoside recognition domain-containing protein n=1 Tax=Marinifaba aquimaris TaxID=2741323 RepID=UPI00157339E4|nr:spore maturation protein [Marinifaba aquimaris]NTS76984.1 spore maturation protein [Marinifaba aquimaris]